MIIRKKCPCCATPNIQKFGKTAKGTQRYFCNLCSKSFTFKSFKKSKIKEKHWFDLWITEGFNVRQIVLMSKRSRSNIQLIIEYWMNQNPKSNNGIEKVRGIMVDGTFIEKRITLFAVMDAEKHNIISAEYPLNEFSKAEVSIFLLSLKKRGLMPKYACTDGNPHTIAALRTIFPNILIQRCLTHIQRQGLAWCRTKPKSIHIQELRRIIYKVPHINSHEERLEWEYSFREWMILYKDIILGSDKKDRQVSDIIRAVSVLTNAIPDMFHYLDDTSIPKSTSCLEGYFSRLKHKYFAHRGLSKDKRKNYFKWFISLNPK